MDLALEREKLHEEFRESVGDMPNPPPLDLEVLYKESRARYDEWKISYVAETSETMPARAGQSISAYLLIPRWKGDGPFPAMVCFHQCNVDCVLAKDAVVGKTSETTLDQRYGFELVQEGFVVLAPDSLNCGERNIPSLRQRGEDKPCWPDIFDHPDVGRSSFNKKIYDGIRAVDLLQSLDFVDSNRIGAIGHSMGNSDAFNAMAYDPRVQAVILSGTQPNEYLPLHAPRLHMAYRGMLDADRPDRAHEIAEEVRTAYEQARPYWETTGSEENLVLHIGESGHVFMDDFKKEAYARLKRYFGLVPQKSKVSLKSILEGARQDNWHWRAWSKEERHFPEIEVLEHRQILVDKENVQQALAFLFVHLYLKLDESTPTLRVWVTDEPDVAEIHCAVPARNDHFPVYFSETGEKVFIENGGALKKVKVDDMIEYIVTLPC